jgi:hypothetical protein
MGGETGAETDVSEKICQYFPKDVYPEKHPQKQ